MYCIRGLGGQKLFRNEKIDSLPLVVVVVFLRTCLIPEP